LWMAPALQEIFGEFSGFFVSTVVCPACSCSALSPLALMSSASEVPIGSSTSEGRCLSRSVLALG
ncbi:hypothetical protein, partial [Ruegeria sp. HKCCD8929]|uniref:hypothetical protein n=1 Tax=Ruegeria sp. HKCCD8929 TaxID=2683006 RepID=UPI001C2CAE7E